MPEKERARLREQYVKEFRERRKIRRTLESARRRQSTDRALGNMVEILNSTRGTTDECTMRLDAETALNEARLEIALEKQDAAPEEDPGRSDKKPAVPAEEPPVKTIGPQLRADIPDRDA